MDSLSEVSILAVFLVGLLGGAHCAVMCGPIVTALNMAGGSSGASGTSSARVSIPIVSAADYESSQRITTASRNGPIASRLAYNIGRIGTYTLMGAIIGGLGAGPWLVERWLPVQQLILLFTSLTLLVLGLYLLRVPRIMTAIESVGQTLWRLVQPVATKRLFGQGLLNAFAAGALWGLLPCGMVYGALAMALVSGDAATGALVMVAFGLGTLPNLLLVGVIGEKMGRRLFHPIASRIAGVAIVAFGVFGLVRMTMTTTMLAPVMQ